MKFLNIQDSYFSFIQQIRLENLLCDTYIK